MVELTFTLESMSVGVVTVPALVFTSGHIDVALEVDMPSEEFSSSLLPHNARNWNQKNNF